MRPVYWISGASVLTAIAFFLPGVGASIWTSLMGAMSVVGLFFLGLLAYIVRKAQSTAEMALGIGVLAVFTALALHVSITSYYRAQWKHRQLTRVRATVDKGLMNIHLNTPLLETLKARYREQTEATRLRALFMERYGDKLQPGSTLTEFVPKELQDKEFPVLYYDSTRSANKVVLVGRSGSGNGEDPGFSNYDGSKGNLQYRSVLTPRGVNYVREN